MKSVDEREKYDDFELEEKYAAENHIAYQTLINTILRSSINKGL